LPRASTPAPVAVGCEWHQTENDRLGYIQWHWRAEQTLARGGYQRRCRSCRRYIFAWESRSGRFSDKTAMTLEEMRLDDLAAAAAETAVASRAG
jgi:hypothetical protein